MLAEARRGRMRLVGPNCLGLMRPRGGLNATFAGAMALSGNVGFISQSGALCTSVLDWSLKENVGFSAFVSIGSMLDGRATTSTRGTRWPRAGQARGRPPRTSRRRG